MIVKQNRFFPKNICQVDTIYKTELSSLAANHNTQDTRTPLYTIKSLMHERYTTSKPDGQWMPKTVQDRYVTNDS